MPNLYTDYIPDNTTVYISGPMSGMPDANFALFSEAATRLRDKGFCVLSPHENEDGIPYGSPWTTYLKKDVPLVAKATAIALLPDWRNSRGVKLEIMLAVMLGIPVYFYYGGSRVSEEHLRECWLGFPEFDVNELTGGASITSEEQAKRLAKQEGLGINAAGETEFASGSGACKGVYAPRQNKIQYKTAFNWETNTWETETAKDNSETILQEAQRLVHGDRGQQYGHPFHDFSRTAKIWEAILGVAVTPLQVALCMIGVKISRICNKPSRDSVVDIAGYAETASMVMEYKENAKKA